MEKIEDFVKRTAGPAVPFVSGWYPWVYAHHYLRCEVAHLPAELGAVPASLSLDDARHVVVLWSGLTGERVDDTARVLADAYLLRWGIEPPGRSERGAAEPTGNRAVAPRTHPGGTGARQKPNRRSFRVVRPFANSGPAA